MVIFVPEDLVWRYAPTEGKERIEKRGNRAEQKPDEAKAPKPNEAEDDDDYAMHDCCVRCSVEADKAQQTKRPLSL